MKKGFSLIELMVVIAIIAILAAIALPLYSEFSCKSRAQEMYNALKDVKGTLCNAKMDLSDDYSTATWGDETHLTANTNATLPNTGRWTVASAADADNLSVTITAVDAEHPTCLAGFSFVYHIQNNSDGCRYQVQGSANTDYIKDSDLEGRI